MLAKFVTTEEEWAEQKRSKPHETRAGLLGPGTTYKLYSSMTGHGSEARARGTGFTKDVNKIKVHTEKNRDNN